MKKTSDLIAAIRLFYPVLFVLLMCTSCSSDEPEPEAETEEPEPVPDPDDDETGWAIDTKFTVHPDVTYVPHIEKLSTGKMIIAAPTWVGRINANGSFDFSFPTLVTNGEINTLVLQTDGKILIGGDFTTVDGKNAPYIARINTNGTLDTEFNANHTITPLPSPHETFVNAIAVQPDGKIIAGGSFLARFNSSGTVDNTFKHSVWMPRGTDSQTFVNQIITQADNKIVIVGDGISAIVEPFAGLVANDTLVRKVLRLNPDGTSDETFKHKLQFKEDGDRIVGAPRFIVPVQDGYVIGADLYVTTSSYDFNQDRPMYFCTKIGLDGSLIKNLIPVTNGTTETIFTLFKLSDKEILIGRKQPPSWGFDAKYYSVFTIRDETRKFNAASVDYDIVNAIGEYTNSFSEVHDVVKDTDNSIVVAGWLVREMNGQSVKTATGLMRLVKK